MSYNIIKSLKIDDENKRVIIAAASNNVRPRTYCKEEAPYFTRLWAEKGREAVEIELVKAFESGNFQGGSSKYKLAADRLRRMADYRAFNWRLNGADEYETASTNRREKVAEFDTLVLKALKTQEPKEQFVIVKKSYEEQVAYFYHRANAHFCRWYLTPAKAKVFKYREEAENMKKSFQNSDNWEVLQVA